MKAVQVIENIEENGTEWVVSLTDINPKSEDCFIVSNNKEAFRIKAMLEEWGNRTPPVIGSQSPPMSLDDAIIALGVKENYADLNIFLGFIMFCLKNVNGFYEWFNKTYKRESFCISVKIEGGFYLDLYQVRELFFDNKCAGTYTIKNRSDGEPFPNTSSEMELEINLD